MGEKTRKIGDIQLDKRLLLIVVLTTVAPMLDYYNHKITGTEAYDRFILYFLLPAAVILLLFREPLTGYGFKIGDWQAGLLWTIGACLIIMKSRV